MIYITIHWDNLPERSARYSTQLMLPSTDEQYITDVKESVKIKNK